VKLHWSPRSPFVRKVMIVAHEKSLLDQIELVRSPVAMTQPNATLMRDNPLSKLPTLVLSDGTCLYDSHVICEYFDVVGTGPALIPDAREPRFAALRREALGDGILDMLVLWRAELGRAEAHRQTSLLDAFLEKRERALDALEQEAPALEATPFSLGHVALVCALEYLEYRFAEQPWRSGRPKLAGWVQAVHQRPSVLSTVPRESDVPDMGR